MWAVYIHLCLSCICCSTVPTVPKPCQIQWAGASVLLFCVFACFIPHSFQLQVQNSFSISRTNISVHFPCGSLYSGLGYMCNASIYHHAPLPFRLQSCIASLNLLISAQLVIKLYAVPYLTQNNLDMSEIYPQTSSTHSMKCQNPQFLDHTSSALSHCMMGRGDAQCGSYNVAPSNESNTF